MISLSAPNLADRLTSRSQSVAVYAVAVRKQPYNVRQQADVQPRSILNIK